MAIQTNMTRYFPPGASWRVVFRGMTRPRMTDVIGIITKRSIADAVIDSYED